MTTISPAQMSNCELLDATVTTAANARHATAELLALLSEVDTRRLYLGEGCSSLFAYCRQVLHLSEHAAYHRIEVARAARQYPIILGLVATGDVTLTTIAMLRRHLTAENHEALLGAARYKSKREVEYQIACLAPKPVAKALIRRMPDRNRAASDPPTSGDVRTASGVRALTAEATPAGASLLPPPDSDELARPTPVQSHRPSVAPLASDSYLLRVTLSTKAHAKLRHAQDLMRHTLPNGDPAAILERALDVLVDELEKTKNAKTPRPRETSRKCTESSGQTRYIPASVKRAVWARDKGRCAFVGPSGRCTETGCLEYHHVIPFARGGTTEIANIALRCRPHNNFESELLFGRWEGSAEPRTLSGTTLSDA